MPFGRRKAAHKMRATRGRDPFDHLADERHTAETDPWFLQPDDGPALDVQAGVSSNLRDDDLDREGEAVGADGLFEVDDLDERGTH